VRIKVEACGICHSDALVKEGHWPELSTARARTAAPGLRIE
jgi:D-arabinose 1-dehydrogenase-like Zn-dependent alcohol dehydrogenase